MLFVTLYLCIYLCKFSVICYSSEHLVTFMNENFIVYWKGVSDQYSHVWWKMFVIIEFVIICHLTSFW